MSEENSEEFVEWINRLNGPKLRALASQAGITGWAVRTMADLQQLCSQNAKVVDIYEEHVCGA